MSGRPFRAAPGRTTARHHGMDSWQSRRNARIRPCPLIAEAFVVGVGDFYYQDGAGPMNTTVADARGNSAQKCIESSGLLFCERNKNRR